MYNILMIHSCENTESADGILDGFEEVGNERGGVHAGTRFRFVTEKNFRDIGQEGLSGYVAASNFIILLVMEIDTRNADYVEELTTVCRYAWDRDKMLLLIIEQKTYDELNNVLPVLMAVHYVWTYDVENPYQSSLCIWELRDLQYKKNLLYEKTAGLMQSDYREELAVWLVELILLLIRESFWDSKAFSRRKRYKEILRCMEQLSRSEWPKSLNKDQWLGSNCMQALDQVAELGKSRDFQKPDLFLTSLLLRYNYLDYHIRNVGPEVLERCFRHDAAEKADLQQHLSKQNHLLQIYDSIMASEHISDRNAGNYPDDEMKVILQVDEFRTQEEFLKATVVHVVGSQRESKTTDEKSRELYEIADYMKQMNRLFEMAGKENAETMAFIRCLKTSYERLKNYSTVAGCGGIVAECVERIAELNQELSGFNGADSSEEVVESGIKALLGFNTPGSSHYDVFISYKHEDRDIAESMYHFLQANMMNPFLDFFSLPELSNSDYEKAIMYALDHSDHFVVILSKLDYLQSNWVDLEMSTFLHEIREGRKAEANFLLVVTDEVYREIMKSNKNCLPIQYRRFEIFRVSEYRDRLPTYLRQRTPG